MWWQRVEAWLVVVAVAACGGRSNSHEQLSTAGSRSYDGGEDAAGGVPSGTGGSAGVAGAERCSFRVECSNGILEVSGSCAAEPLRCREGCRSDMISSTRTTLDPTVLCEEYQGAPGASCLRDFDCLAASSDSISFGCSAAGSCEPAAFSSEFPDNCGLNSPPPALLLGESLVMRGPSCASGICVVRHSSIDPSNTMCTSACSSDADCAEFITSACFQAPVHLGPDPEATVGVCMPPAPW